MGQSGGFLGRLLGSFLKIGFRLIGNVLKTLVKSVSIPLGLTTAASATDAAIHKNFGCYNINNVEWRNEWCYEGS